MEGAIAALREVHPVPKIPLVVNEVTKESRAALADGYAQMVISTPLAALCADLISHMVRSVKEGDDGIAGQHFLEPHLVLAEML